MQQIVVTAMIGEYSKGDERERVTKAFDRWTDMVKWVGEISKQNPSSVTYQVQKIEATGGIVNDIE